MEMCSSMLECGKGFKTASVLSQLPKLSLYHATEKNSMYFIMTVRME